MVYWHGNAEDIGCTEDFLLPIRDTFNFHILAIEYPGYGMYDGIPSGSKIREDCDTVYGFLTRSLNIREENIMLFGRSLGSGPAIYTASKYDPAA